MDDIENQEYFRQDLWGLQSMYYWQDLLIA
jgi:hypothetical protein